MDIQSIGKVLAAVIVGMLIITLGVVVAMVVFGTPGQALADTYTPAGQVHGHR